MSENKGPGPINRLARLSQLLLDLGPDPAANLRLLVSACGDLLGASCVFYNVLREGRIVTRASWGLPPDLPAEDQPRGSMCRETISSAALRQPLVISDLPHSRYADQEPFIRRLGLRTYAGQAVPCDNRSVGSLAVLYRTNAEPAPDDLQLLGILALALGRFEERLQAAHALRESQQQTQALATEYEMIFDVTRDGLWLVDVTPHGTFVCRRINATAERLFGVPAGQVMGKPLGLALGEEAGAEAEAYCRRCVESGGPVAYDYEQRMGGELRTWHCALVPIVTGGLVRQIVGTAHDITDRKRMEEEIRHLSFHDKLTGLFNRRYFEEELSRLAGSRDYPIAIICSDVDGLKLINDTMGHSQGDRVLKEYARLLRLSFRRSDLVARVGGDEFAVALTRTEQNTAHDRCARLEEKVLRYNRNHPDLPLSMSLGIATAGDPGTSLEETFNQADKAMYQDKIHRTATAAQGIVRALLATLAQRDAAGEGHTARMVAFARRLAEAAHVSKADLSDVMLLAEMHDLGHVGISDKVLQKNGPLTEGERDEVRQHPMMGYRIARASPELSHIADLILHHHERWDGAGYPMGLAGEDIPMGCRIIAVVDAFDAMVSERSYRGRLLTEQAVQELLGNAGRQFDPALVEKFVELLNSGKLSEVAEEAACVDAPPPEAEAVSRPASAAGTPSGSNGGARND